MKKTTIFLVCLCLVLAISGCKNNVVESREPDNLSVSKYSEETKRHYEETSEGYKAAFYAKSEIYVEEIENWLNACERSDLYYEYIYSDPDSWDMFIYYAPENGDFHRSSFQFSVDGSLLIVYITSDPSVNSISEYILIRIQAPLRGVWPSSSEIYFDGVKLDRQDEDPEKRKPAIEPTPTSTPTPTPTPTPAPIPSSVIYKDIDDLQFSDLSDMIFSFYSGAGAWSTEVQIMPDGTFTGLFHDSEMGNNTEEYPEGTIYYCSFNGKFTSLEKTGAYEYSMKCEFLEQEGTPGDEIIEEGFRFIISDPYGFTNADMFSLYLPGKKVDELPQAFIDWVSYPRAIDISSFDVIDFWGLYNISGEQGFGW